MTRLPDRVRIGPYDFDIVDLDGEDAEKNYGAFDYSSQTIAVLPEYPTPFLEVDTVLHEILHGIFAVFRLKGKEGEEHLVSTIATGLTMVLRDNPKLRQWLDHSLERTPE
jgi:hypothetical protein